MLYINMQAILGTFVLGQGPQLLDVSVQAAWDTFVLDQDRRLFHVTAQATVGPFFVVNQSPPPPAAAPRTFSRYRSLTPAVHQLLPI